MLSLGYGVLLRAFRKGLRNGTWRKLDPLKKAHFRAAMAYSKITGEIVNSTILKAVLDVIKRLTSPLKRMIWQRGLETAHAMRRQFGDKGVFDWCPQLRGWLEDHNYIFYLGVSSVNSMYWGGVRS